MADRRARTGFQAAKVRAPQLPSDPTLWLNTGGRALSIARLRGRVVLLDFWTAGCINCRHVIPDLAYLEAKYANHPFIVIGVHSGKFATEKTAETVRHAVARYGIAHPVVRDDDFKVWNEYTIRAWPTFVLIDTQGYVLGSVSGEGNREALDKAIAGLLSEAEEAGLAAEHALTFAQGASQDTATPLRFPGKLLADEAGGRLFIADTAHHRIVVCGLDGSNPTTIGSGEAGRDDGDYTQASFRFPQGMTLVGSTLWVCDSGNHLLRRIDLDARRIATVAGTSKQAPPRQEGGAGLHTPLSSPSDVCYRDGQLHIAMSGTHTLWRYELQTGLLTPYAGSGREARTDGVGDLASFAQPESITTDDEQLFVVDSESSSVRAISFDTPPKVTTLAGGDLFDFGDKDGKDGVARLQHPLGICEYAGLIYIADTYNQKIKQLTPETGEVETLAGNGVAGLSEGTLATCEFNEPAGLSVANGKLYIADTNNHRVRVLDFARQSVESLEITGLCAPNVCLPNTIHAPKKAN